MLTLRSKRECDHSGIIRRLSRTIKDSVPVSSEQTPIKEESLRGAVTDLDDNSSRNFVLFGLREASEDLDSKITSKRV